MKIKTVTCHHVYNYGATLQAFALQSYLEGLGHEVEIVDFRLPAHSRYEWFTIVPAKSGRAYPIIRKYPFLRFFYYPLKRRSMLRTWGRKRAFDRFDRTYLHLTPETLRTTESLRAAKLEADVLVAGSDQIWNTDMDNGITPAYYLDFGPSKAKRISYAASFGVSQLADDRVDFVRENLQRFDSISVREATGLKILENLGYQGLQVVDPVFLLSREEWMKKLGLREAQGEYIFLYDFTHDDEAIRSFALALSRRTGLRLVSINDYSDADYAHRQVNNAGPREFLQWLLGARYVVCNSFHATAFSLIFGREFFSFPLVKQRNPSRMTDLLADVGLSERFKPTAESGGSGILPPPWEKVYMLLNEKIRSSKLYLKESL